MQCGLQPLNWTKNECGLLLHKALEYALAFHTVCVCVCVDPGNVRGSQRRLEGAIKPAD